MNTDRFIQHQLAYARATGVEVDGLKAAGLEAAAQDTPAAAGEAEAIAGDISVAGESLYHAAAAIRQAHPTSIDDAAYTTALTEAEAIVEAATEAERAVHSATAASTRRQQLALQPEAIFRPAYAAIAAAGGALDEMVSTAEAQAEAAAAQLTEGMSNLLPGASADQMRSVESLYLHRRAADDRLADAQRLSEAHYRLFLEAAQLAYPDRLNRPPLDTPSS